MDSVGAERKNVILAGSFCAASRWGAEKLGFVLMAGRGINEFTMKLVAFSMIGLAAWLAVGDLAQGREQRRRETHKEKLERLQRERDEKREARRRGDGAEKSCGCKRKCKCRPPGRPPLGQGNQAQREQRYQQRERQGEQRQNQRNAQQEQRERQRKAQNENR